MKLTSVLFCCILVCLGCSLVLLGTGCAQIGSPTGGPKDSIPPVLVSASPKLKSVNFTGNKFTLIFNEYVEVKDPQTNVLISPFPKKSPAIDFKLKTVTVKLKDSLAPNTTYSINFGDAIVDLNEGNPLKNFVYTFSTGNTIDSFELKGKVLMAETGKPDSTLIAMLYRNITDDSAVQKNKPDYIARLAGDGSFTFVNLPAGRFRLFALKDGDGGKTYSSRKEEFAFMDAPVSVSENTTPVLLYASAIEKESKQTTLVQKTAAPKKLVYSLPPGGLSQDLLGPFTLNMNSPLKDFDTAKLILRDTNYKPVPATNWSIDSSRTKISLSVKWQEGMPYRLILDTTALSDSAGNRLLKADTIKLTAKQLSDYGNVVLRFSNLNLSKKPVLQLIENGEVKKSFPLQAAEWSNKYINPGEYEMRILFDENGNGKWDPGNYSKKQQPETVIGITQKLAVRANWDNERDIKL